MKLKSLVACSALVALAINPSHGVTAAGRYTVTQLDATSGFPRSSAYLISDTGVVGGAAYDDEAGNAFAWTAENGLTLISLGGNVASAYDISANGILIGAGTTPGDTETRGFVWRANAGVTTIPGLGGRETYPNDVNTSGVVVGESQTSLGETHPFRWSGSGPAVDLGTPGMEGAARFVSNDGLIVGVERPATDDEAPDDQKVGSSLFAILPTGQRIAIGKLGFDMYPERMNRRGAVIGSYVYGDGLFGSFFWSVESGLVDLVPGDPGVVAATSLSDTDIVVGYSESATGFVGFKWTRQGGFVTVPSLGGADTFPNAVNSSGLVAGTSTIAKKPHEHAFAWTEDGGIVDLGTLQGGDQSYGFIVGEDGTILGSSDARGKKQTRTFAWTPETGMIELPSLGGPFDAGSAVNASGIVAGVSSLNGKKGSVDERAVIWTPVSGGKKP